MSIEHSKSDTNSPPAALHSRLKGFAACVTIMLHSAMLHRIIVILSLIVGTTAWTIPAYMDLVYPKRWTTDIGDAYLVKDGEQQDGASNSVGSCLNKEVPKNVTRSLFPITGGNLRFAFVNESRGDGSSDDTGKFRIDMYFLAEPERTNPDFDDIVWMKRMEFWYGFTTGDECVVPMDMTTRLKDPGNQTAVDSLEGLNVTLTWQIRNIRNYKVFEQVDQVCLPFPLTQVYSLGANDRDT